MSYINCELIITIENSSFLNQIENQINSLDEIEFIDFISRFNRTLKLDYPSADLKLFLDSLATLYYRKTSCKREPATVKWIEKLPEETIFFDVGANVGAYFQKFSLLNLIFKVFTH